jgi:hypothetical protein
MGEVQVRRTYYDPYLVHFFPSEVYRPLLVQFSAAFLATQLA